LYVGVYNTPLLERRTDMKKKRFIVTDGRSGDCMISQIHDEHGAAMSKEPPKILKGFMDGIMRNVMEKGDITLQDAIRSAVASSMEDGSIVDLYQAMIDDIGSAS